MDVPGDRRYTSDHEWAMAHDGRVRMGVTDFAQDALGDVVYVQLPDAGSSVDAGAVLAEVESTKSVSEVYAPVSGRVVEVNRALSDAPQRVNDDPYGEGWICIIDPADPDGLSTLMDAEAYGRLIAD